jgi:hypothetical protein
MEALHAAIAAYLRQQRWQADLERAAGLAGPGAGDTAPRCRYCGTPIDGRDGGFPVAELLRARACAAHHNRPRPDSGTPRSDTGAGPGGATGGGTHGA